MRKRTLLVIFLFQVLCSFGQKVQVIPSPANSNLKKAAGFKTEAWVADCENDGEKVFNQFAEQIKACGIDFPFREKESNESANLVLRYVKNKNTADNESYQLKITRGKALLEASTDAGMFYGLQTLAQLTEANRTGFKAEIPKIKISDNPRFGWRGLMLDESRHFFGKEKVKQLLDWMAFYKLNVFHWHLTDVNGWRIEIKKYPLLTEVGGIGNFSDSNAPAQYYTQNEIRGIVQYANERFIEIIPEVDMPGHATAANKAYPEYSGGGSAKFPHFTFNPGNEKTYGYLTDILKEITQLFPSKYIHLGGDEVHFGNEQWNTDPQVQALMKKNQLKDLKEVESYFIKRMTDSITALNKTMIGWDEIVTWGVAPDQCRVMWWRHNKPDQLMLGLEKGYQTVMCPRIPLYFDFVQDSAHTSGRRWDGDFSPLEKILEFNQIYKEPLTLYPSLIVGVQANLWSETIHSGERLDFMTYPRIAALAEIAWSNNSPEYKEFLWRLKPSFSLFEKQGVTYFNPENRNATPEIKGPVPPSSIE
ncbi:hexosaminidase [Mariniphaga anaerophila]|uniref:beta-N-acetylhexosaminidase n=1 Tax=Mariniphaga anaerophila TaxID=1484053 RepID=A0A1M4SF51_9BACT|nr:beta-N-acetylhexosaminidase [Mariniphaga anaerophila]SHE30788.1 hexosaminidase [Mariniphaga anaerophila]